MIVRHAEVLSVGEGVAVAKSVSQAAQEGKLPSAPEFALVVLKVPVDGARIFGSTYGQRLDLRFEEARR